MSQTLQQESDAEKAERERAARAARAEALDKHAPRIGWVAEEAIPSMELRGTGAFKPVSTPWPALNAILGGGLWPGLHVLTGTTGSGKTQLALQIAALAGAAGTPALYVALELQREELVARVLSIALSELSEYRGRAPMWSDLYLGRAPEALRKATIDCGDVLRAMVLRMEEAPAGTWTAGQLEERAQAMREAYRGRTPLIVVDYLQIVGPEERDRDLRMAIRSAALRARNVARQGAAVLLLSSVSRENAKLLVPGEDQVRPPQDPGALVGLGKESGEIEYSADTVLALSREEFRPGGTRMHLAAAKVRAGRPGWVSLSFDGSVFSSVSTSEA